MAQNEQNQIDDLATFLQFVSGKPSEPLLSTPPNINPIPPVAHHTAPTQRKSFRIASKAKLNPGKDTIQLAQQVLVNKLGELSPQKKCKNLHDTNQLAKHLPQPINDAKMEAIRVLVEQGNQARSKKKRSRINPSPDAVDQAQEV